MKNKGNHMSRLIIDGNSVFEIDEECVRKRKIPPECDIEKYLKEDFNEKKDDHNGKKEEHHL